MIKIDAVGIDCPRPVIMTKKEFDNMEEGTVQVLADNKPCVMNLEKFASSNGFSFKEEQIEEDRWEVTITKKSGSQTEEAEIPDDLIIENQGVYTLAIGTRYYGTGYSQEDNEKFGKTLMESFIYTVAESKPYPDNLIFFNSGIFLSIEGSSVLDDLKRLEEAGVEIYTCGACLDYYEKADDLAIGEVSNMYLIYETIRDAGKNIVIA